MPSLPEIRLVRVDPRLVHATLMNAWVPYCKATWILVADRGVAADGRSRTIFQMSARDVDAVRFTSESAVMETLIEWRPKGPGIVLFSTLIGVLRALRVGFQVPVLNVGHIPEGPGKTALHPAIHVGPAEMESFRQLKAQGVDISIQARPDDTPIPMPESNTLGTGDVPQPSASASDIPRPAATGPQRVEEELKVVNEKGLHLRAAHVLAQCAGELEAHVEVGHGGNMVNAKSLLGLTTLGAACGSMLKVVVEGPNADQAMEVIRVLFAGGFQEGVAGARR